MTKEFFEFFKEEGDVAYLIGLIDGLLDALPEPVPKSYIGVRRRQYNITMDHEVLYLGENNEIDFTTAFKTRMYQYTEAWEFKEGKKEVKNAEFEFIPIEEVEGKSVTEVLLERFYKEMLPVIGSDEKVKKLIDNLSNVFYKMWRQLDEPLHGYVVKTNGYVFEEIYRFATDWVYLIEYQRYAVVILVSEKGAKSKAAR